MQKHRTASDIVFIVIVKPARRVIGLMVALVFLVVTLASDISLGMETFSLQSTHAEQINYSSLGADSLYAGLFDIPSRLGAVKAREIFPGEGKKVIHIQDAHCNYACQKTIAELIAHMSREYGIRTVNLEGGSGEYDLSVFTGIEDTDLRSRVSDYFVKEGILNGAEYYAANYPDRTELWGIEDVELYLANLDSYRGTLTYQGEIQASFRSLSRHLRLIKERVYSDQLMEMDERFSGFKSGQIDMRDYLAFLFDISAKQGFDARKYANVYLLSRAMKMEEGIDFRQANVERSILIDRISKRLPLRKMDDLAMKTLRFRSGEMSQKDFYWYLAGLAGRVGLSISDYGELEKFTVYVSLYDAVNKSRVMSELNALEEELKLFFFENEEQKELSAISRDMTLLENMFKIRLTREDYTYYRDNERNFSSSRILAFMEREAPSHRLEPMIVAGVKTLDAHREKMAAFYEYSFKRDRAFVENLRFDEPVTQGGNSYAILVTGGFHSENLYKLFRENGVSYVSIMPEFEGGKDSDNPYFRLLAGENPEVLDVFSRDSGAERSALALFGFFCKDTSAFVKGETAVNGVKTWVKLVEAVFSTPLPENEGITVEGPGGVVYTVLRDAGDIFHPADSISLDIEGKRVLVTRLAHGIDRDETSPGPRDTEDINLAAGSALKARHREVDNYIRLNLPAELRINLLQGKDTLERRLDKLTRLVDEGKVLTRQTPLGRDVYLVPIKGLFNSCGQFGHIGLGRAYGRPVIWIDEDYKDNETVIGHELEEIDRWEDHRLSLKVSEDFIEKLKIFLKEGLFSGRLREKDVLEAEKLFGPQSVGKVFAPEMMRWWIKLNLDQARELAEKWHDENVFRLETLFQESGVNAQIPRLEGLLLGLKALFSPEKFEKFIEALSELPSLEKTGLDKYRFDEGKLLGVLSEIGVDVISGPAAPAALYGGRIKLSLDFAEEMSDDEMLFIMGHEIGHELAGILIPELDNGLARFIQAYGLMRDKGSGVLPSLAGIPAETLLRTLAPLFEGTIQDVEDILNARELLADEIGLFLVRDLLSDGFKSPLKENIEKLFKKIEAFQERQVVPRTPLPFHLNTHPGYGVRAASLAFNAGLVMGAAAAEKVEKTAREDVAKGSIELEKYSYGSAPAFSREALTGIFSDLFTVDIVPDTDINLAAGPPSSMSPGSEDSRYVYAFFNKIRGALVDIAISEENFWKDKSPQFYSREDYEALPIRVPESVFSGLHISSVISARAAQDNIGRGDRVLVLGTGMGLEAYIAVEKGAHVDAVDINPDSLDATQELCSGITSPDKGTLRTFVYDIMPGGSREKELADAYDVIIFNMPHYNEFGDVGEKGFSATEDPGGMLLGPTAEIVKKCLAPGGRALLVNSERENVRKIIEEGTGLMVFPEPFYGEDPSMLYVAEKRKDGILQDLMRLLDIDIRHNFGIRKQLVSLADLIREKQIASRGAEVPEIRAEDLKKLNIPDVMEKIRMFKISGKVLGMLGMGGAGPVDIMTMPLSRIAEEASRLRDDMPSLARFALELERAGRKEGLDVIRKTLSSESPSLVGAFERFLIYAELEDAFGEFFGDFFDFLRDINSTDAGKVLPEDIILPEIARTLHMLREDLELDRHIGDSAELRRIKYEVVQSALTFHDRRGVPLFSMEGTPVAAGADMRIDPAQLHPLDAVTGLREAISFISRGEHPLFTLERIWSEEPPERLPAILAGGVYYILRKKLDERAAKSEGVSIEVVKALLDLKTAVAGRIHADNVLEIVGSVKALPYADLILVRQGIDSIQEKMGGRTGSLEEKYQRLASYMSSQASLIREVADTHARGVLRWVTVGDTDETLMPVLERLGVRGITGKKLASALAAFTWIEGSSHYPYNYGENEEKIQAWLAEGSFSDMESGVRDDMLKVICAVYYDRTGEARPDFAMASVLGDLAASMLPGGYSRWMSFGVEKVPDYVSSFYSSWVSGSAAQHLARSLKSSHGRVKEDSVRANIRYMAVKADAVRRAIRDEDLNTLKDELEEILTHEWEPSNLINLASSARSGAADLLDSIDRAEEKDIDWENTRRQVEGARPVYDIDFWVSGPGAEFHREKDETDGTETPGGLIGKVRAQVDGRTTVLTGGFKVASEETGIRVSHENMPEPVFIAKVDEISGTDASDLKKTVMDLFAVPGSGKFLNGHDSELAAGIKAKLVGIQRIVLIERHPEIMGIFSDDALYISKDLIGNEMALIHELGESLAGEFLEGYLKGRVAGIEALNMHTYMRGAGKDVHIAYGMLDDPEAITASGGAEGLIDAINSKMAEGVTKRDAMTPAEEALIKLNFKASSASEVPERDRARRFLYGFQDRLDPGGNVRLSKHIDLILRGMNRKVLNIMLIPSYDITSGSTQTSNGRRAARKLFRKFGTDTLVSNFNSDEDVLEKLEAAVREAKNAAKDSREELYPKIFVNCVSLEQRRNIVEPYLEGLSREVRDMVVVNHEHITDPGTTRIDEVATIMVGTAILNDHRLSVDFGLPKEALFESRRNMLTAFSRAGIIDAEGEDLNDAGVLDNIMKEIYQGLRSLRINRINWEEIRDYQDSMRLILQSV